MTDTQLLIALQTFHLGFPFYRKKPDGNGFVFHKFHDGRVYTGSISGPDFSPESFKWVDGDGMCQYILLSLRLGRIKPFDYQDKDFEGYLPDDIEMVLLTIPTSSDLQRELDEARDALVKHKIDLEEERKSVVRQMEKMRKESELGKADLDNLKREYFHKGWRKAEEKYKQQATQEDAGEGLSDVEWLAKTLMVDSSECDPHVWYKARKQYMLAHHPDRNKWADPEMVAKVNSVFDKVFK